MHKFFLNLTIALLLPAAILSSNTNHYDKEWLLVDSLIEKQEQINAIDAVHAILDKAKADDNDYEILRCALMLNRLDAPNPKNARYSADSYMLFDSLESVMDDEGLKAICHYLEAICLKEYLGNSNYRIPSGNPLGIEQGQLKDRFHYHFNQAFSLARRKRTKDYIHFIPDCSDDFLKLRPKLNDVLMENSCFTIGRAAWSNENPFVTELLKSDERLLGDASQFLKAVSSADLDNIHLWQIHTLKLLTENNLRANADVRATIDYKRLKTIAESVSPSDWISVSEKIERLADSYRRKSRYSACIYMLAAKVLIEHVTDQKTIDKELRSRHSVHAHELLLDAIGIWPDSENAQECRELLSRIEKRKLSISFDRIEHAGVPNLAMLTYSNIDTVWFKAIRYDKSSYSNLTSNLYRNDFITMIQDGSIPDTHEAASWSVATAQVNHNDWIEHSMWVLLPALEKGEYIIVASPDRKFRDESCYAYRFLTSSRILFTPTYLTDSDNNAELTGFLSDASTGAALSDCSYTLYGYDEQEESDFNIQGRTGEDGFIRLSYPSSAEYDFMLIVNNDTYTDTLEFDAYGTNNYSHFPFNISKGPVHVKINTDRAVYRPGDTIRYNGIVSETPPQMDGHVMAGMPVVVFISANRQDLPLQETVSDVHGCFEGEWPIPADFRAGWIDLCAFSYPEGEDLESIFKNTDEEYLYLPGNSKQIKIESYSRQLLQLKFDQLMTPPVPGSEVECTGRVFSILGNPVGGALIQWSTSVSVMDDESFASGDIYIDKILETGKTQTRPDGSFSIRFKADAGPRGWIELTTRVTDGGGETHEDSREIYMYNDPSMGVSVQNSIIGPDDPLLTVRTYGNYPWTGQYKVRIEALHQNQSKGIDIYTAFKVRESERKEMSETALTEGVLTELFPEYEFGLPATPQVSHTLMDSTFVSHGYKTDSICVPGIRTGLYRITMTSDSVDINHKGNTYSQDIFISVDYSTDPLTVNDLLWMPSRRDILREGDTATVRIGSPYPGTIIRYDVINRNGSLTHGTMIADGMTHTISFPVNEDLCGSILIVATAFKDGMKAKSYCPGYIPYYSKQLKYELTSFRSNLTSGNEESWTFRFTDSQGKPVRASVMASMYDSSLDRIERNRWEFFPWRYMEFITADPVRINQIHRELSSAKTILPFKGFRSIGLGIADPLTTPLRVGLPIPLREVSSSASSASEYIPYMIDNNRLINNSDNQVSFMEPADIRKNLSHTGLYKTGLQTDQDGYVTIRFKAPELLTRWNFQVFAYTDSLLTTGFGGYVTTSRPLMVEPSVPRFFRQGDVTDFVQKVTNTMESDSEVTVKVSFTDADSRNSLDLTGGDSVRIVSVKAGGSVNVPFRLTIPEGIKAVTYTVTAASGSFSDGQQETVQVLSNRVSATRSMSLFNNGNETRLFRSNAPELSATGRITDQELTLQYHSHPIFYAIDALPSLTENREPDNISLLYDFAARCMSAMIADKYPSVRNRLDPLYNDSVRIELMLDSYMEIIRGRLNPDGGMPWMPGGASSAYVTSIMLYIFDFLDLTYDYNYNIALRFLASCVYEKTYHLSHQDIMFLYLYSKRNKNWVVEKEIENKYNTLLELAAKYNHKNEDLYYRGLLIQMFMSCGNTGMAHRIADDLIAESGYSDELGRYWDDNRGGYLWHEAPVETQAVIIRALKAAGYDREADESARWLLKQKETTSWESTLATAMAVMALLETSSGSLPQAGSGVTVTIGNERIESAAHGNDDGYMSRTWSGPVSPDKAVITVTNHSQGMSWGALYHTFTQDLADVEQSGNGMHLERTLYRIVKDTQGEHLEEITPGTTLSKGDRIKVKLNLSTDRTYEYVRLRSQRAASLEPVSTKAEYTYNITRDLLYYWAPANTSDDLYIERLEKGTYSIEYELYVQKSGTFSMGLATIECLYAPAYRAIAPNTVLNCQ